MLVGKSCVYSFHFLLCVFIFRPQRAIWVDLTGDGRKSILTARATFPLVSNNSNNKNNEKRRFTKAASNMNNHNDLQASTQKGARGQLVCLEMPEPFRIDEATGTQLERDGTVFDPLSSRHLPWKVQ